MSGIYIHVPFCKKKCIYCDFYSVARLAYMPRYANAVVKELELRIGQLRPERNHVETIYIGGGTPSLLPPQDLSEIVGGVFDAIDKSCVKEFTVEVNPDDVNGEYAKLLASLGVNRVSIGVQSFNDRELATINRRHDAVQAINAVKTFQHNGIRDISIDLIFGLPGQTVESLSHNVKTAIGLGVQHVSVYNLSYEEGTALWRMREKGLAQEADEETTATMYETARRLLADAGFEHYEVSNFAKPGYRSIHNSNYWNGTPYLGLGPAAHSYYGNVRMYNCHDIKGYLDKIENGETAFTAEDEEWWERYDETVMVRLRTSDGLDIGKIRKDFGENVAEILTSKAGKFVKQGVLKMHGDKLSITGRGVLVSDYIIRELMWDN